MSAEIDGNAARPRTQFYLTSDVETLRSAQDVRVVVVPSSRDKAELLHHLAEVLQFPDWFGMNWDALYDCLGDLGWFPQRRIILVHSPLSSRMLDADLRTYLEVLQNTIEDWRERQPGRELGAAFDPADFPLLDELGFRRADPGEIVTGPGIH